MSGWTEALSLPMHQSRLLPGNGWVCVNTTTPQFYPNPLILLNLGQIPDQLAQIPDQLAQYLSLCKLFT